MTTEPRYEPNPEMTKQNNPYETGKGRVDVQNGPDAPFLRAAGFANRAAAAAGHRPPFKLTLGIEGNPMCITAAEPIEYPDEEEE